MTRRWLVVLVGVVALAACGNVEEDAPVMRAESAANAGGLPSAGTSSSTTSTSTTSSTTAASTSAPVTTTVGVPVYTSTVRAATAADLGASWREDCPVSVDDLRWLDVVHWNDAGEVVDGAIVVHADHADDVTTVFGRLFDAGFPIHMMRPITEFDGDDVLSMSANNTSAFNCREIAGRPGVWSQHAYGGAIDINPLVNPWVRGNSVDPPAGAPFVDRDPSVVGLIVAGDVVTQAFADIGWGWGGDWASTLDYQHFSHNGR